MMTPQEIQDVFERYNEAIRKNIPISESLAKEMADATKGVRNYTNTLNYNLKSLGTSFKTLSKDMYDGAKGASVFNNTLESGAEVVSTLLSRFGLLGLAIGGAVKLFTMFVGAANKQSDALYKSYQDISRAGAAGKEGLTGVYGSMKQFGYTLDQLNEMGALLKENSKSFGLFTSSALTGAKQFGNIADTIQNSSLRKQFFNLGMTVDDINRGIAGYMVQEGKLGKLRGQSQAEVSKGAAAYIREMEILTRLTGQTRQEMEEQRERAMQIDAFYASLDDLPKEAREQALQMFNQLAAVSPKLAEEYAQNFSGVITGTTDMLISSGAQSLKYGKEFFAAGGKATEGLQGLSDAIAQNKQVTKGLAQVGGQLGISYRDLNMLTGKGADGFSKSMADVTSDVNQAGAGYDKATNAQSAMRDNQIKTTQSMQDFVNLGVTPVTRAMSYLASVVENLTSLLPGAKSKGPGKDGTGTQGGRLAAVGAGAAAGAAAGSLLGPVGTIAGGLVGGLTGFAGYQMHGGVGQAGKTGADLQTSGLRIKSEESTAGGAVNEKLMQTAMLIQEKLGNDLVYFSAFNDRYHQGLDRDSAHKRGTALDFTLADPSKAAQVAAMVRSMAGVKYVKDEYANLSSGGTGGHIHAEINGAAGFQGMLSGPMSGYKPNITMHGTEELSIRPSGSGTGSSNASTSESAIFTLIERVDELVYLSKTQIGVNEKILRYQQ